MRDTAASVALIDGIVGRCVRDPAFARAVISDPRSALAGYGLDEGEEADFLALREKVGAAALAAWSSLRQALFGPDLAAIQELFQRDGFVVVPGVLRDEELDAFAAAVDAGVARRSRRAPSPEPDAGGPALHHELTLFLNLWEDDPAVRRWTFHQGLAAVAARLLKAERVRLLVDQVLYKEAQAPGTSKHQDVTRLPVEASRALTAWIPFDGATVESGTLGYLPGSHRVGRASQYDLLFGRSWREEEREAIEREPVFVEVPRGGVLFHHPCTFHLSAPNRTERRRRAFGIVYFADGARRESSYPHPSLDRAGVQTGEVIAAGSTPVAFPLPDPALPPAPPEPLRSPPAGWPGG